MSKRLTSFGVAILLVLGTAAVPPISADDKSGPEKKVAHIRLTGSLDEGPVADDPLFGGHSENFKSKIDRIKKAQNDKSVQAILIHIDGMDIGWAKVDELRASSPDFRK